MSLLQNFSSGYYFSWSNDGGTNWQQQQVSAVSNRPTMVYDRIHDKVHILYASTDEVKYLRYAIQRDAEYNITGFVADADLTPLVFDELGPGCSTSSYANPILLLKENGSNGILVAFWTMSETCGGSSLTESRASLRVLSNTAADGIASNWSTLNGGSSDGTGSFDANVAFNSLYSSNTADTPYQHGAVIRGGSGARSNDIYYFNTDHTDTNGFRRLSWNSGSSNWSGSWTSRTAFGGNVGDSSGYNLKKELLTKPIYDSIRDRVYVGIARWLDDTNGDTQSLFYVDSTDAVVLAGNVSSAGGAHCLYPTLDISLNPSTGAVYTFYDISTNNGTCGHVAYKVFDGTSFGNAQPFWSNAQTVDIPVVYQNPINAQFHFLFRVNNLADPSTPPHDIYFGTMDISDLSPSPTPTISITSPHTESSVTDFNRTCSVQSSTEVTELNGGEVGLQSDLYSDFNAPTSPYTGLFYPWTTGAWGAGSFTPTPSGSLVVPGGFYALTSTTFTTREISFRARFGTNTFQHIGWTNSTDFNRYTIVSTMNQTTNLYFRVETGSGESNVNLGPGPSGNEYLGNWHTYTITTSGGHTYLSIDGTQVADISAEDVLADRVIVSNNDTSPGSQLSVDWLQVKNFATSGTYTSCTLDSGTSDSVWGVASYDAYTTPGSVAVESRSANVLGNWTSWYPVTSGASLAQPNGRYLQYRISLTGTATMSSLLSSVSLQFSAPPLPSPSPTSSLPSPQLMTSFSTPSQPHPPQCSALAPGQKAPQLYAARVESADSVRLYFAEGDGPIDHYSLSFGRSPGSQEYGSEDIGGTGTRTYLVTSLESGTTYYFRVRGGHGCAAGNWSNELSVTTPQQLPIGDGLSITDTASLPLNLSFQRQTEQFPTNTATIATSSGVTDNPSTSSRSSRLSTALVVGTLLGVITIGTTISFVFLKHP
jgi:hypothetical protein